MREGQDVELQPRRFFLRLRFMAIQMGKHDERDEHDENT